MLEMGRNSVMPSMIPRIIACRIVIDRDQHTRLRSATKACYAPRMQQNHRDAIIGYLVFPYPFIAKKLADPFVKYHAYQTLGGAIVGFALQGFISVLGYWIYTLHLYSLRHHPSARVGVASVPRVPHLCGITNVQAGKQEPLPWIGAYARRLMN